MSKTKILNGVVIPSLVNQVDDMTCVHACLAMVTGRPIEDVIRIAGAGALVSDQERMFLAVHGILTVDVPIHAPFTWAVYLVSAPSLNLPPQMHRLVVYADPDKTKGDPWIVLDPQSGRDGRKFYDVGEFNGDVMAFNEMTLLRRAGSDVDVARYLAGAKP